MSRNKLRYPYHRPVPEEGEAQDPTCTGSIVAPGHTTFVLWCHCLPSWFLIDNKKRRPVKWEIIRGSNNTSTYLGCRTGGSTRNAIHHLQDRRHDGWVSKNKSHDSGSPKNCDMVAPHQSGIWPSGPKASSATRCWPEGTEPNRQRHPTVWCFVCFVSFVKTSEHVAVV